MPNQHNEVSLDLPPILKISPLSSSAVYKKKLEHVQSPAPILKTAESEVVTTTRLAITPQPCIANHMCCHLHPHQYLCWRFKQERVSCPTLLFQARHFNYTLSLEYKIGLISTNNDNQEGC
jgi:hypothetical protein